MKLDVVDYFFAYTCAAFLANETASFDKHAKNWLLSDVHL